MPSYLLIQTLADATYSSWLQQVPQTQEYSLANSCQERREQPNSSWSQGRLCQCERFPRKQIASLKIANKPKIGHQHTRSRTDSKRIWEKTYVHSRREISAE